MKTLKTITDLSQVPTFRTLAQEAAFWDGHQLAPALWAESQRGDAELDQALNGLVSVKVISSRPADLKGKGQPTSECHPLLPDAGCRDEVTQLSGSSEMMIVGALVDIPEFGSLIDESRYWDTHTLAPDLLDRARPGLPPAVVAILGRPLGKASGAHLMQLIVDLRADAAYLKFRKGRVVLTREVAGLHVDQDARGAVLGVEVLGWTEHLRHFGLLGVLSPLFQSVPETSPNAHTANFSP